MAKRGRKPRGVTSREYKLMLNADRFADQREGALALADLVRLFAEKQNARFEQQGETETRQTYYVDTPNFALRRAKFALRVRYETAERQYKIALKHRTPDRYLAAAKDLSSPKGDDGRKFEEDILPRFRSVFSQSNSLWFKSLPALKRVRDGEKLFPGLKKLKLRGKTELRRVNGFEAQEVFVRLCKVRFVKRPKVKVGLSFWYHNEDDRWPLAAECAFDYDTDRADAFPKRVVRGANGLFSFLQQQPGWFDLEATTKTSFAYEGLS